MPRDDGPHVRSKEVYFFVVPGFADWEAAHALAELRRHGGYEVQVVGFSREPVQSMGGVTVQPTRSLAEVARDIMAELAVLAADDRAYWAKLFRGGRLPAGGA